MTHCLLAELVNNVFKMAANKNRFDVYNFDEFKRNGGEKNYYKVQTQQQIGCLAF